METCKNCKFWRVDKDAVGMGYCKVDGPQFRGVGERGQWPQTGEGEWCGKWQPDSKTSMGAWPDVN